MSTEKALTTDEYWSRDGEWYGYDSLGELLDSHDDLEVGDVVHFGTGVTPDPAEWVDADDVIEQLACQAYDNCGEAAEDYPAEVSAEAKAELETFLESWARKHCTPTFYMIKDAKEYTLTGEDLQDEPPEPDGECYRGGEAASALAEEQARIQRELK